MTSKQLKNLAKELAKCELIHNDENASKEAKLNADNRIMQITNKILSQRDGFELMAQLDDEVQLLLSKEKL